ncbi:MAG: hypothetical protein ACLGHX_06230 [Acidimicrobiia bacterium]
MRDRHWFPPTMALVGGVMFVFFGVWALASPRSFFDQLATFAPYNRHFVQDIGAFQIGLGAALLAARFLPDALLVGLAAGAIGSAAHTVSHVVGTDLGGTPAVDIPTFAIVTVLLAVAAGMRWRELR